MGRLQHILLSTLLFIGCNSNIIRNKNERELLLPDADYIYRLAFPDTLFYKVINERVINPKNKLEDYIIIKTYDANFDSLYDLEVTYKGKMNPLTKKEEIDSSKAPVMIAKWNNSCECEDIYVYNRRIRMYEHTLLIKDVEFIKTD